MRQAAMALALVQARSQQGRTLRQQIVGMAGILRAVAVAEIGCQHAAVDVAG